LFTIYDVLQQMLL